jgi:hypothetical protein
MYIDLHVIYPYSGNILIKFEFSRQIVEIYSNIKFHENPFVGAELFYAGEQTEDGHLRGS